MLRRRPLLALPALALSARAEPVLRLSLLHINDFHSRHLPFGADHGECRPGAVCFGGSARLAAAIAEARAAAAAAGRTALLLDAGDQFTGSLFFTRYQGLAEAEVQNAIGVAAMALGNHEFDRGPAVLAAYAQAVRFPLLAANLDATAEPVLQGVIRPAVSLHLAGHRICLIGLVTPETAVISSPGPALRFTDPAEAAERAIHQARREGPCTVILLAHLGLAAERRLVESLPGVDVLVGGHSHTLLGNGVAGAAGPYPVLARGVPIVQAGAFGRWLGRLDLDLGADGRVLAHGGNTRPITADLPEDPAVAALVARLGAPLAALRAEPVAHLPAPLSQEGCGSGPCALGSVLAAAMRAAVADAEIGFTNGGGIRAGLPAGTVTLGDVLTSLPFQNSVARMLVRGATLREALEHGVARLPAASGRYPQTAGLRFALDPQAPPGRRIGPIEVERGGAWQPLDPDAVYVVATNNFLRQGGDGYAMFRDAALEAYDAGLPLEEALIAWLRR
ncbi:MAG: 5'-nucleotidase C-terminal domain-containing protein [Rhodovarius sp.]|nr:5'-nucleotidase C-terminal domain-containing protein [Rhodovarius sp.]